MNWSLTKKGRVNRRPAAKKEKLFRETACVVAERRGDSMLGLVAARWVIAFAWSLVS